MILTQSIFFTILILLQSLIMIQLYRMMRSAQKNCDRAMKQTDEALKGWKEAHRIIDQWKELHDNRI